MPFNSSDVINSWKLMKEHAKRGDSWARTASNFGCKYSVDATVCICRENAPRSDINRDFDCKLKKNDAIILFASTYRRGLKVAFEVAAVGAKSKWNVLYDAEPCNKLIIVTLPPQPSYLFRRQKIVSPVFFYLKSESEDDDHVRLIVRFVPDAGLHGKLIESVLAAGHIGPANHWKAEVAA